MTFRHISVMPKEVEELLDCRPGRIYVDGTLGGSGHASTICRKIAPDGMFIGIDQDKAAIENARRILSPFAPNLHLFHDNFSNLPAILSGLSLGCVDGILLDLGLSLHQIEQSGRGFSFSRNEPLDMRMNTDADLTAEDLVNGLDEKKLADIFRRYGEERWSGKIAKAIVRARSVQPIRTSGELAELIAATVPKKSAARQKIHPATRVFMALRIAVNSELERLEKFLDQAADLLSPGGRLVILAFHSLEDRIVKRCFKQLAAGCICPPKLPTCICGHEPKVRLLTRKPWRPTAEEVAANPMARSTRCRAVERL